MRFVWRRHLAKFPDTTIHQEENASDGCWIEFRINRHQHTSPDTSKHHQTSTDTSTRLSQTSLHNEETVSVQPEQTFPF